MKNAVRRPVSMVLAVMMIMVVMFCVFSVPAKADWNSYVGTWQCRETQNLGVTLNVYTDGTAVLLCALNPAYSNHFTYYINGYGFLCASDGTVLAPDGYGGLTASNGYHWYRVLL